MKYKVITHWGGFQKHPPREGELSIPEGETSSFLERIFEREQNEATPRNIPSASIGDIIELEDGRLFVIDNDGYSQVKTKDNKKSFLVDQGHGCRKVQFSAWRLKRPNIRGYGMTTEEAIYDLTQNVQPL